MSGHTLSAILLTCLHFAASCRAVMAAAKRAWCSGSNDFNVVAADSGSERPPCLPSDSRMAEAAKRRRLAEVFDELDDVSSDSCWSSTSESSSSSSDDDDEVYAAAFQQLFSLPERRPKVEAYVTKTVASYSDEEFKRISASRGRSWTSWQQNSPSHRTALRTVIMVACLPSRLKNTFSPFFGECPYV
nr:uncharacterized protein LOC119186010 [Rhipicephalus microplus]